MPSGPRVFCAFLLALLAMLVPRAAMAACEPGNLLAGKGDPSLAVLTDGVIAREEAPWPEPSVVRALHGPASWDLGRVEPLGPAFIQGDADQSIDLETSLDGENWTKVSLPPSPSATGMFGRVVPLRRPARFVRLSTPHPSGTLAITEFIVACDVAEWTPDVRVAAEPDLAVETPGPADLTTSMVDAIKLVIALATIALLAIGRSKSRALFALAGLAALAYYDFGALHRPRLVHEHDVFHYFVGSRYFPELGYDGLYDCATAAEAEAGFTARIDMRAQRDLRTNALVPGTEILKRGGECRARFSDAQWADFTRDVRSFASRRDVRDWHRILKDHGFNATPTWIAASVPFSRGLSRDAASAATILSALDVVLLLFAFGALFWAFGREIGCIAIIALGCNPLADFAWLGGAFLRQLWFASLLIGIALLARRRAVASGIALALASLVQLFPVACLAALFAAGAIVWRRTKAMEPLARRALVAATLTVALALPASEWISGRAGAWPAFIENTAKHAATPSANLVGLPTVLSFRPSTRAAVLFDEQAVDPFAKMRAARRANFDAVRPVHWIAILAVAFVALRSLRSREPPPAWWASALGIVLVPFVLETSSYYTAYMVVPVVLARDPRRLLALPILAAVAAWLAARLAGLVNDVYYVVASAILVVAMCGVLVLAGRDQRS